MNIIRHAIACDELKKISEKIADKFIKAVVDVESKSMAIDCEKHVDGQALLLQEGSLEEDLWGITIYPHKSAEEWIECYSTINLKPLWGNPSYWVEDKEIQDKIKNIVNALVIR